MIWLSVMKQVNNITNEVEPGPLGHDEVSASLTLQFSVFALLSKTQLLN